MDAESSNPLSFATVGVIDSPNGTITNEDGDFQLSAGPGSEPEVRYTGFATLQLPISEKVENFLILRLEPAVNKLSTFNVIEADERALQYIGLAKKQLELYELSKVRLGRTIEEYFRKTNSGSSLDPLMRYNDELKVITCVDNAALFFMGK